MTITDTDADADLEAQIGAYADRLFETGLAALEAVTVSLGRELHLYEHLATDGGVTAGELAAACRHRRPLRAGVARAASRRRAHRRDRTPRPTPTSGASGSPPPPRSACSAPRASPRSGPCSTCSQRSTASIPAALVDAYRTGGGIPYADYALHDAQGDFNRPAYVNLLASDWLTQIPGLVDRLQQRRGPRRRDRLRRGLGRDLLGPGVPRAAGRRLRQRRGIHRRGPQARRRGRCERPGQVRGHRRDPRPRRPASPSAPTTSSWPSR